MVCESVLGLSCSLYTHEHKDPSRMETRKLCRGSVREYCSSSCPLCLLALGRKEGEGNNCWPRSLDQREGGTFASFFFGGGGLQLNVSGLVFRICLCHEVLGTFGDHSEVWDVDLGDRIEHIVGSRLEDDIHMRTPSPVIVALHHGRSFSEIGPLSFCARSVAKGFCCFPSIRNTPPSNMIIIIIMNIATNGIVMSTVNDRRANASTRMYRFV